MAAAAAEARREKFAGNDAYINNVLNTAVAHYTRGALLDPSDISFLTNRAAAYLHMRKYQECVRDCDEAVKCGRELNAGNRLIAKALSWKASALLELAARTGDYAPAVRALEESLAEHYTEETRDQLGKAKIKQKEREEQKRDKAADLHRERGLGVAPSHENGTPSYFICPISQEIMNDPHIAADGFTYEAEAIATWLDSGHYTSPMTNMRLEHGELIPNRALRSAIQEWLQQHNVA